MNTLIVLGLALLGMGLLIVAAAGMLIITRLMAPPPRARAHAGLPRVQRDLGPPPESLSASSALTLGQEEDDEFSPISTGVLNVSDFEDFEELIRAANAMTRDDD